jgi:hypothetical protein
MNPYCLYIFITCAQLRCYITHSNLSVFQNLPFNMMNVHICDTCRLHVRMWSVSDLFTAL